MAILLRRTPSAVAFAPHLVKLVDPLLKGPKRRQLHSARELTSTPAAPPVVLAHGFLGFDELSLGPLRLSYYGSIASLLRAFGFSRILTPVVPPTGSVSLRAESLQAAIHKFEGRKPCERVIVIGHSMGGLDARHLCSRLSGDSLVSTVTLTTGSRLTSSGSGGRCWKDTSLICSHRGARCCRCSTPDGVSNRGDLLRDEMNHGKDARSSASAQR